MRKYKSSWESVTLLKEWIQSVPDDPSKAYCRACNIKLCAHRYSVLKHTATKKHQDNYERHLRTKQNKPFQATELQYQEDAQKHMCVVVKNNDVKEEEPQECLLEEAIIEGDELVYDESFDVFITTSTTTEVKTEDEASDKIQNESSENLLNPNDANMLPAEDECHIEISSEIIEKMPNSSETRTISSHILDTSVGKAAANVEITIYRWENNQWCQLNQAPTNDDGRCTQLVALEEFKSGIYKLHFNVRPYFDANGVKSFYPFIEIVIECTQGQHYHVPLLLNPFGYSTYRGT